ncbi:hypothetical protein GCM10009624_01740 [Gordonia sinesedis]
MTTDTSTDRRGSGSPRGAAGAPDKNDGTAVWRDIAGAAAVVAVTAALACAVFFGYRAYQAYFVDYPVQQARDESVGAAEQAMLNVTTIDPKNLNDWKRRLNASLTGDALKQVSQQDYGNLTKMVEQSNGQAATLTSRLKRSAPTEVDAEGGEAKVLVYVDATSKRENQAGQTQTMGFLVTMTRDDQDRWKASKIDSLDAIEYTETGAAGTGGGAAPAPSPAPEQNPGGGN